MIAPHKRIFHGNQRITDRRARARIEATHRRIRVDSFHQRYGRGDQFCDVILVFQHQEALALQVESREKVDDILNKALASGGREPRPAEEHGFMYGRAFEDPDSHIWEAFWMDAGMMEG